MILKAKFFPLLIPPCPSLSECYRTSQTSGCTWMGICASIPSLLRRKKTLEKCLESWPCVRMLATRYVRWCSWVTGVTLLLGRVEIHNLLKSSSQYFSSYYFTVPTNNWQHMLTRCPDVVYGYSIERGQFRICCQALYCSLSLLKIELCKRAL